MAVDGQRHALGTFPPFIGFILAGKRTELTRLKAEPISTQLIK